MYSTNKIDTQIPFIDSFKSSQDDSSTIDPYMSIQKASLDPSERVFLLPKDSISHFSKTEKTNLILTNSPLSLQQRKAELDKRFNLKLYRFYYFWLYVLIVLSTFQFISSAICAIFEKNIIGFYMSCFCSFWLILQSHIEIRAIKYRNLLKARQAMKLMIMFIPIILTTIVLLSLSPKINEANDTEARSPRRYLLAWIYSFCVLFAIHLLINLGMAVKVKNILTRIETLEHVFQQNIMYNGYN